MKTCPFCGKENFAADELKLHLSFHHCDKYNAIDLFPLIRKRHRAHIDKPKGDHPIGPQLAPE